MVLSNAGQSGRKNLKADVLDSQKNFVQGCQCLNFHASVTPSFGNDLPVSWRAKGSVAV
jgi:hypothetical protein